MTKKYYSKPYRIKKKKSVLKNRFFWFSLLILIVAGGVFYLVGFASFFQIKNIQIVGQEKINESEIKNLVENKISQKLFLFSTKSIFLVNLNGIKNSISQNYPQIAAIKINRALPNSLLIEIQERKPWAMWCSLNYNCFYIDEKGIVFSGTEEFIPNLFKIDNLFLDTEIKLGDSVIEKDLIESIQKVSTKFKENIKIDIEKFIIPSQNRLNVKTVEGWEVYFEPEGDLNWQIIELGLVLEKEIPLEKRGNLEYIDLRFSKIYYRMK